MGAPLPYPMVVQSKQGMNGCAIAALVIVGVVVVGSIAFWIVAALFLGEAADRLEEEGRSYDAAQEEMQAIEEETGIETDSANLDHPPQRDLQGEVTCDLDARPLVATGRVTNHSSETSRYLITVSFTARDGTRLELAHAEVDQVAPGETARWEAVALGAADADAAVVSGCRVTHMNRYSSTFDIDGGEPG